MVLLGIGAGIYLTTYKKTRLAGIAMLCYLVFNEIYMNGGYFLPGVSVSLASCVAVCVGLFFASRYYNGV